MKPRLLINPIIGMFDQPFEVFSAVGLTPGKKVKIALYVSDKRFGSFESAATFIPKSDVIRTDRDAPINTESSYKDAYIGPRGVPCVIDLFGTGGGCIQHRAALLASHGFASLALAYFDYEDLPDAVYDVDLTYFQEAIDWLRRQSWCMGGKVGAIGTSLGGDLVLLMGCHFKHLSAIVPINGMNFLSNSCPLNFNGNPIPTASGSQDLLLKAIKEGQGPNGFSNLEYQTDLMRNCDPAEEHPIELAPKDGRKFMFICSGDDRSSPAFEAAMRVQARCESFGIPTKGYITVEKFDRAGHLLEPPYVPHARVTYHKMMGTLLDWGGEPEAHNDGQKKMWVLLRQFLAQQLGSPAEMPAFGPSAFEMAKL